MSEHVKNYYINVRFQSSNEFCEMWVKAIWQECLWNRYISWTRCTPLKFLLRYQPSLNHHKHFQKHSFIKAVHEVFSNKNKTAIRKQINGLFYTPWQFSNNKANSRNSKPHKYSYINKLFWCRMNIIYIVHWKPCNTI